jgi:anti-sigma regulatory factor (Ser/Thr protein kinase)
MSTAELCEPEASEYRHEALFYSGRAAFVEATLPFLNEAITGEEPTLVVVSAAKIADLRQGLGAEADRIVFADMAEVGTNPARIIPAWESFLLTHGGPGRRLRGIGEPIWSERTPAELVECERHEALLNAAFGDPAFWLLCPYDTDSLSDEVLNEAQRNHPFVTQGGRSRPSAHYPGIHALVERFDEPLSDPAEGARALEFTQRTLPAVRRAVSAWAGEAGLIGGRASDLVMAANEIATNSLRYGGGRGTLLVWRHHESVLCEVRDGGRITNPMVDRVRPDQLSSGGRGLWLANQLCDLVQIRSGGAGTVVRLHMRLA